MGVRAVEPVSGNVVMRQDQPPDPGPRRVHRRFAPMLPIFLIFVVVLLVANTIYRTSREEMVAHFQRQQEVLAKQFALGMEEVVLSTSLGLSRMAKNISRLPIMDEHVLEELEITWDIMGGGGFVVMVELKDAAGATINRFSSIDGDFVRTAIVNAHNKVQQLKIPVVSELLSLGGESHFVYIGVPVLNRADELVGELGALVSISKLMERAFDSLEKEEIGAYWILTDSGVVVFHSSHPEMMTRNIFEEKEACLHCHDGFEVEEAMTRGADGHGRTVVSEDEKLVSYAAIKVEDRTWSIAISDSVSKATRPFAESTTQFLVFTLVLVAMLFVAGFFVLRAGERTARAEEKALNSARLLQAAEEQERLNRELEQAHRMAVLGEMVARVAHEIKNPIQYMGTGFDLLKHETAAEEKERIIDDIGEGLSSLDAIVQELLNFGRPMKLEPFPTDIRDLAEEAIVMVPEGVAVDVRVDDSLSEFPLDGIKIKQLLTNLVDNAVAAMDGKGTITLAATSIGDSLQLRVKDSGKGIEPENLNRVFTPFYTTRSKGVGLGMSVVRRILDLHKGSIDLSSVPGKGTEFVITIPNNLG